MFSLLSAGSLAHAEMGPYVGISAGLTSFDDDGFIQESQGRSDWDSTGTAFGFLAGYKFSDNFSMEWNFRNYDYGEYGIDALSAVDMQAWHISSTVGMPFKDTAVGNFDIFGKFGFGESDYSYVEAQNGAGESQTGESFILGGGAQFYIDEHFRIRTEVDITTFVLDVSYANSPTTFVTKDYLFTATSLTASLVYMF
jgi:hypothetical protein